MRVLLVVHGYPPAASGGTEIYTQQLADALSELSGLEVFVLTRDCDPSRPEYSLRQEATATGVTVYRINNTFQACSSFEDSYANPALASVAARIIDQEIDPDVIHIQHLTCLSTEIVKHASAARRPVAMTLNDYWLLCHRGQLLRPDGTRCDGPFDGGCASCVPAGVLAGPTVYRAGRLARTLPLPGVAAFARIASGLQARRTSTRQLCAASEARLEHMRDISSGIDLFLAPSATMEAWAARLPIECWRLFRCDQGIDLRAIRAGNPPAVGYPPTRVRRQLDTVQSTPRPPRSSGHIAAWSRNRGPARSACHLPRRSTLFRPSGAAAGAAVHPQAGTHSSRADGGGVERCRRARRSLRVDRKRSVRDP